MDQFKEILLENNDKIFDRRNNDRLSNIGVGKHEETWMRVKEKEITIANISRSGVNFIVFSLSFIMPSDYVGTFAKIMCEVFHNLY